MAKVNLDQSLLERVQQAVAEAGYSNVEEFITRAIEQELLRCEADLAEVQVADQLRGLGYLE